MEPMINKETAWNWIAGIVYHNDDVLYSFNVYMEIYIPGIKIPVVIEGVIWISAVIRIVICMFPQNNWCTDEGNMKLSVIRNAVFAVTGIGVMILYLIPEIHMDII